MNHSATLPPEDPPSRRHTPPKRFLRTFWVLTILLVLALAVYFLWPRANVSARGAVPGGQGEGKKGGKRGAQGDAAPAAPVVAVRARRGDIGVYFNGLGTVTLIYTVTVRSRVDGELMNVRYREGDLVHKGDLLMEIDPRPYQAQLNQFEGNLMRDQAALQNARTDVARYETLLKQNAIPEQQLATQ